MMSLVLGYSPSYDIISIGSGVSPLLSYDVIGIRSRVSFCLVGSKLG